VFPDVVLVWIRRRHVWRRRSRMLTKLAAGFFVFSIILVSGCIDYHGTTSESDSINAMGYNVTDVNVFLKLTDMSYSDFLGSQTLRQKYERWSKGQTDNETQLMMERGNAKNTATQVGSSAMGGALVGSMLGGMLFGGSGD
jgi:hypothetical protein